VTYTDLIDGIMGEITQALHAISTAELNLLLDSIINAPRVYVAGRGRSGLLMRAFAMRLMHAGLTVHVVDDVTTPAIAAGDLLVIGSGSGGTASLVQYATRAKVLGAQLGLITTSSRSVIGKLADVKVIIRAASPKIAGNGGSIQPMANLFEQSLLLTLDMLTIQLMAAKGLTSEQMFARHANLE
jgi:6-phospho-3-hexuloisomerase